MVGTTELRTPAVLEDLHAIANKDLADLLGHQYHGGGISPESWGRIDIV